MSHATVSKLPVTLAAAFVLLASPAFAADDGPMDVGKGSPSGAGTADPAMKPDAPSPEIPNPAEDVRTYAGVGGNTAYAERGVVELGGSFSFAAQPGSTTLALDPSIGYFLFDNVELSGVLGVRSTATGGNTSNNISLVVEPSVWFPVNDGFFLGGGMGVGVALLQSAATGIDTGLTIAPRLGGKLLLGRSGLLNFGARYSIVAQSVDADLALAGGETVVAFVNTFDIQGGYTIMF